MPQLFSIINFLLLFGNALPFTDVSNRSLKIPLPKGIQRHGPRSVLTQRNQSPKDGEDGQDFWEKISLETTKSRESKADGTDIDMLMKQKEQRETMINRLKFQLNEFKATVAESEKRQMEAEEKVAKIKSDSEDVKVSEERAIETMQADYR